MQCQFMRKEKPRSNFEEKIEKYGEQIRQIRKQKQNQTRLTYQIVKPSQKQYRLVNAETQNLFLQNKKQNRETFHEYGVVSRKEYKESKDILKLNFNYEDEEISKENSLIQSPILKKTSEQKRKQSFDCSSNRGKKTKTYEYEVNAEQKKNKIYVPLSLDNKKVLGLEYQVLFEPSIIQRPKGGIVNLNRWKYTTRSDLNKIIIIQRWWRYMIEILKQSRTKKKTLLKAKEVEVINRYCSNCTENQNKNVFSQCKKSNSPFPFNPTITTNANTNKKNLQSIYKAPNTPSTQGKTYFIETKKSTIYYRKSHPTQKCQCHCSTPCRCTNKNVYKTENKINLNLTAEAITEFDEGKYNTFQMKTTENKLNLNLNSNLKLQLLDQWLEEEEFQSATKFTIKPDEAYLLKKHTTLKECQSAIKKLTQALKQKQDELTQLTQKINQRNFLFMEKNDNFTMLKNFSGFERTKQIPQGRNFLEILPTPKEALQIQSIRWFSIEQNKEKEELICQYVDCFNIPKVPRPQSEIQPGQAMQILGRIKAPLMRQGVEMWEILKAPREENVMEKLDNIVVLGKEKAMLMIEEVDQMFIEKNLPDLEVQVMERIEVKKVSKKENVIDNGNCFVILAKEKEALKMQPMGELFILRKIKVENFIDKGARFMVEAREKEPFEEQVIEQLMVVGKEKAELNEQNVEQWTINKTPSLKIVDQPFYFVIKAKEKEALKMQLMDKLFIEKQKKPELQYQVVDQINIEKEPRPENIIEIRDNIEIMPIVVELFRQNVDSLTIQKEKRPDLEYQKIEEINVWRKQRAENVMQEGFRFIVEAKEKHPLEMQIMEQIMIKSKEKPELIEQNIEKWTVDKTPSPKIIDQLNYFNIPSKKKEPLKCQLLDHLFILKQKKPELQYQAVDQILIKKEPKPDNIIEGIDNFEIFPIEIELFRENVDSLTILKEKKPDLKYQKIEQINVLRKPKAENLIQEGYKFMVEAKGRAPLDEQTVDQLMIISKEKAAFIKQSLEQWTVNKTPSPKIMDKLNYFQILAKEKEPFKSQLLDELFIEKQKKPELKYQVVDQINIEKEPRPDNIIEGRDNIEILPIVKELFKQNIDSLTIEKAKRPDYEYQKLEEINVGKKIKFENIMQEGYRFKVAGKEKEPLKEQIVDQLMVVSKEKPELMEVNIEQWTVDKTPSPKIIDQLTYFEIHAKEKEPFKCQILDELFIEKQKKPELQYQVVDQINIEKEARPDNMIEARDDIEILPIKKELFKQNVDSLTIEKEKKPDYEYQKLEEINVDMKPKSENQIQEGVRFGVEAKEKAPLEEQTVDQLIIISKEKPELVEENIEQWTIDKTPSPKIIDQLTNIYIQGKEKEPFKCQILDELFVEKQKKPELKYQVVDQINIEKEPRPDNMIEARDDIEILPIVKELFKQNIDSLTIEKEKRPDYEYQKLEEINVGNKPKPENEMQEGVRFTVEAREKEPLKEQTVDQLMIISKEKAELTKENLEQWTVDKTPSPKIFDKLSYFEILAKEKEPLQCQTLDELFILKQNKPDLEYQTLEQIYIQKEPKPDNIIESIDKIEILPIIKELSIQNLGELYIEKEKKPDLEYSKTEEINITKEKKSENLIEQGVYLEIKAKEKDPLEPQCVDQLIILKQKRPDLEYEKIEQIDFYPKERPENIIEPLGELLIPAKEKEPLKSQVAEQLFIISKEKPELIEENIEQWSIHKTQSLKVIEKLCQFEIQKKEKEPLEFQQLGELLIEKEKKPELEFQKLEQIIIKKEPRPENEIEECIRFKVDRKEKEPLDTQISEQLMILSKEKPELLKQNIEQWKINKTPSPKIIDELYQFEIKSKIKEPLKSQQTNELFIEKEKKPELEYQKLDEINIIKTKRKQSLIQKGIFLEIKRQEKEPLQKQQVDQLIVLKQKRPNLQYEKTEQIVFDSIQRPDNMIELLNRITILPEKKKPLETQNTNQLMIARQEKPELSEQNLEKWSIAKTPSQKIFEKNCNIEIKSKEKEKEKKPDFEYQKLEEINIPKSKKFVNAIEQGIYLEFKSKEKAPLETQYIEQLMVPKQKKPELIYVKIEQIDFEPKQRPENIIDLLDGITILGKEREPLEAQNIDQLMIGSQEKPELLRQNMEQWTIYKTPSTKEIYKNEYFEIQAKEKEPLKLRSQQFELFVNKRKKPDLQCQKIEQIQVEKLQRPDNMIEIRDNIELLPEMKELFEQFAGGLYIEREERIPQFRHKPEIQNLDLWSIEQSILRPELEYQSVEQINILQNKQKKEENYEIDGLLEIAICPKIKEIAIRKPLLMPSYMEKSYGLNKINKFKLRNNLLTKEKVDEFYLKNKEKQEPIYQFAGQMVIYANPKPENFIQYMEGITVFPKEKAPLLEQKISNLLVLGKEKPELFYEKIEQIDIEGKQRAINEIDNLIYLKILGKEKGELVQESVDDFLINKTYEPPKQEDSFLGMLQNLFIEPQDCFEIKTEPIELEQENMEIFIISQENQNIELIDPIKHIYSKEPKVLVKKGKTIYSFNIEKYPLEIQSLCQLTLFPLEKDKISNFSESMDCFFIPGMPRPENFIQNTEKLTMRGKVKAPLLMQKSKCFSIEGKQREELDIDIVEDLYIPGMKSAFKFHDWEWCEKQTSCQMQIIHPPRPENEIEYMDEIGIPGKEKDPLEIIKSVRFCCENIYENKLMKFLLTGEEEIEIAEQDRIEILPIIKNKNYNIVTQEKIEIPPEYDREEKNQNNEYQVQENNQIIQYIEPINILAKKKAPLKQETLKALTMKPSPRKTYLFPDYQDNLYIQNEYKQKNKNINNENSAQSTCRIYIESDRKKIDSKSSSKIVELLIQYVDQININAKSFQKGKSRNKQKIYLKAERLNNFSVEASSRSMSSREKEIKEEFFYNYNYEGKLSSPRAKSNWDRLEVQASCFGLLVPNEPRLQSPGIDDDSVGFRRIVNWNNSNKISHNKNNLFTFQETPRKIYLKRQKLKDISILSNSNNQQFSGRELQQTNGETFSILKSDDEIIVNDDYNYNYFKQRDENQEKNMKKKKKNVSVNVVIEKLNNLQSQSEYGDMEENKDIDIFDGLQRHTGRSKYNKYFEIRKTSTTNYGNNNGGIRPTNISKLSMSNLHNLPIRKTYTTNYSKLNPNYVLTKGAKEKKIEYIREYDEDNKPFY